MRPIEPKTRKFASMDSFFRSCCLANDRCSGRITWHHNLIVAGRQVSDDITTLLPLCEFHHRMADNSKVREVLDWIMFVRGCRPEDYPKSSLEQRFKYLCTKQDFLESQRAKFTIDSNI